MDPTICRNLIVCWEGYCCKIISNLLLGIGCSGEFVFIIYVFVVQVVDVIFLYWGSSVFCDLTYLLRLEFATCMLYFYQLWCQINHQTTHSKKYSGHYQQNMTNKWPKIDNIEDHNSSKVDGPLLAVSKIQFLLYHALLASYNSRSLISKFDFVIFSLLHNNL